MASYQVMYWKHIPSQVKAWDDQTEATSMLPDYFQAAIDAYAMKDGATEMDAYLDGWKWPPVDARPGTPQAAGENPSFDFFTNDETDFSGIQLEDALDEWSATRAQVIGYARSLNDEQRLLTGHHERYGEVTVERYLEIALEHDRAHLRGLER